MFQALLLHVFQLVVQRYIDCSMSISALTINLFDQVYVSLCSLVNLVVGGYCPFDLSRVLINQHLRVVSNVLSLLVIASAYLQIKWLVLLVIFHIGSASFLTMKLLDLMEKAIVFA